MIEIFHGILTVLAIHYPTNGIELTKFVHCMVIWYINVFVFDESLFAICKFVLSMIITKIVIMLLKNTYFGHNVYFYCLYLIGRHDTITNIILYATTPIDGQERCHTSLGNYYPFVRGKVKTNRELCNYYNCKFIVIEGKDYQGYPWARIIENNDEPIPHRFDTFPKNSQLDPYTVHLHIKKDDITEISYDTHELPLVNYDLSSINISRKYAMCSDNNRLSYELITRFIIYEKLTYYFYTLKYDKLTVNGSTCNPYIVYFIATVRDNKINFRIKQTLR